MSSGRRTFYSSLTSVIVITYLKYLKSKGTEDPRVAYDPSSGLYYMLYTCYNSGNAKGVDAVTMCLATTKAYQSL